MSSQFASLLFPQQTLNSKSMRYGQVWFYIITNYMLVYETPLYDL